MTMKLKLRRAVKCVRGAEPFLEFAQQNPADGAPWGVLADHVEEHGKPATAELLRRISTSPATFIHSDSNHERRTSDTPDLNFHHVVSSYGNSAVAAFHVGDSSAMRLFALVYSPSGGDRKIPAANIHVCTGGPGRRKSQVAIHTTGDMDFVRRLLSEAEEDELTKSHKYDSPQTVSDYIGSLMGGVDQPPLPNRPSHFRRPAKLMATPQDHEAMQRAILQSPNDDAPKLVYADMLEEGGHEYAHVIRHSVAGENVGYEPTHSHNGWWEGTHKHIPGLGLDIQAQRGI
jgi:uncharacterized protein (TIGR02996 family)